MPRLPCTSNGMAYHRIAEELWHCMTNTQSAGNYQQGHPKVLDQCQRLGQYRKWCLGLISWEARNPHNNPKFNASFYRSKCFVTPFWIGQY